MATDAPVKPKGKGLDGKVGPVPVKVILFVVVALAVYLFIRHRSASQSTSAGTSSVPAATDSGVNLPLPSDSTGGGSSGGRGDSGIPLTDLSPTSATTPAAAPFNFYFNSVPAAAATDGSAGGGNVSSPSLATPFTATATSSVAPSPNQGLQQAAQVISDSYLSPVHVPDFNPGNYAAPSDINSSLAEPSQTVEIGGGQSAIIGSSSTKPQVKNVGASVGAGAVGGLGGTASKAGKAVGKAVNPSNLIHF